VSVAGGTNREFTITANSGYVIDQVLVDGVNNPAAVASGKYTFTNVNANGHAIAATFAPMPADTSMDWVAVGDEGNTGDMSIDGGGYPGGLGNVSYRYGIGRYEVTNDQYAEFLNAADPQGANPNGIYNSNMGDNARGGITLTVGNPGGSKYTVKTNMGNKPVNFVAWYDALRFANWMHNGKGAGSTEDGAYLMSEGSGVVRKAGAQVFLPTSDEWHKAAYYKGGGTNAGYWEYATQSNAEPAAVTADAGGKGSAGPGDNSANWNKAADWNAQNGNVTSVGSNGCAGNYGTFDQNGNVWEWQQDAPSWDAGLRAYQGGKWSETDNLVKYVEGNPPGSEDDLIGFRVATMAVVPVGFTIAATAGPGGSITPSGAVPVVEGTNREFTITADHWHVIDQVLVDGVNNPAAVASGKYTFTNVNANGHAIAATFVLAPGAFNITASAGPGGSITPSGAVPVTGGASREFTITPDSWHVIDKVIVDNVNNPTAVAAGKYTFTNVNASGHTIAATFLEVPVNGDVNLRYFPLTAGQRGTVTCLDSPSISYDIYLPSNYSISAAPLPILYTFSPGGGGMVGDFQSICANLQIITVGVINSANGISLDIIYKDMHAVTRDIRQRVVFDPTAEMAAGLSGGGVACYHFSRFRPQHVAGIFTMAGWMGVTGSYSQLSRVQHNLLVARSTGNEDSKYYLSPDKNFLVSCGAVVNDWSFTGGHEVAPDNVKNAALTWILTTRTMAGSNDRADALAQANNWRTRISAGDRQAVLYEAAYELMDKPRSWYAYQAQLILDKLMNDTTFRTLDVADIARGDFANNHFYYSARGAALNNDWPTYYASMKALTGIMAVIGDRSAGFYALLQQYGFLTPVLTISHDSGQLNLSFSKDTPGLTYTLETSPNLGNGTWQDVPYPADTTNTTWSARFSIPEGSQRGFYRIRTTPTVP
jgi:formylglycine-generating enzyme required for sulfatase activity